MILKIYLIFSVLKTYSLFSLKDEVLMKIIVYHLLLVSCKLIYQYVVLRKCKLPSPNYFDL